MRHLVLLLALVGVLSPLPSDDGSEYNGPFYPWAGSVVLEGTQTISGQVLGGGKFGKFTDDFSYAIDLNADGTWTIVVGQAGDQHHVWTGHFSEPKIGSGKHELELDCPDAYLANAMYYMDEVLPQGVEWMFTHVVSFKAQLKRSNDKSSLTIKSAERGYLGGAQIEIKRLIKAKLPD